MTTRFYRNSSSNSNPNQNNDTLSSFSGVVTLLKGLGYTVNDNMPLDQNSVVFKACIEVYRVDSNHAELFETVQVLQKLNA